MIRILFGLAIGMLLVQSRPCMAADKPTEPAADMKSLRDIPPPEQLPPRPAKTSFWVAAAIVTGALVLAAALVAGGLEIRRRLHRQIPLSPHDWAMRELHRIEGLRIPANGDVEHYHTLLSDVIRQFVDRRWHTHAQQQTTAEFLDSVRQSTEMPPERQKQMQEFLEACDLAKFARVGVSEEQWRQVVADARSLVKTFGVEEQKVQ